MVTPLRPGLALASVAGPIERAFSVSKLPTVAIVVNSPGGSPVQSHLIFRRIRQLAAEKPTHGAMSPAMTADDLATLIESIGDVSMVLGKGADSDKADLYQRLGLRLTFDPESRVVEAEAHLEPKRWATECVEGGT